MAPTSRAYWKGFLRLSLVSVPIELFSAEDRRSEIHFNQIHEPSGKRVNYSKTVKGIGPVDPKDIVSGYEVDDDSYVVMSDEELAAVRLESKRTIELSRFVKADDIDPRFFEAPYYVMPADDYASEGYRVIHQALRETKKWGVGQLTHGGREHLVAVGPLESGLTLHRLRYANEIKPARKFFEELPAAKLDPEMVTIATELIDRKAGKFDPEDFSDKYVVELRKLIDRKAKGEKIITAPEPEPDGGNVVNLMDALRRSLGQSSKAAQPAARAPTRKTSSKITRSKRSATPKRSAR